MRHSSTYTEKMSDSRGSRDAYTPCCSLIQSLPEALGNNAGLPIPASGAELSKCVHLFIHYVRYSGQVHSTEVGVQGARHKPGSRTSMIKHIIIGTDS